MRKTERGRGEGEGERERERKRGRESWSGTRYKLITLPERRF